MIPESEIAECPEFEVFVKQICERKKKLEEYRIYKIDPFFMSMTKQK